MPRYGEASQKSVKRAMRKRKHGTLESGRSHTKVTSRKQAIAIGLEEARKKGAKVPARKSSGRKSTTRTSSSRTRRSSSGTRTRRSGTSRRAGM